ncbi:MAG TPA: amidohydrolase family protein [Microvirga sp.]|nr:amidohydrolase family protein [Microvirga sp.]
MRPKIDAHHHLWQLGRFPYAWLAPDAPPRPFGDHTALKADYLLPDYESDIAGLGIVGSVFVEANAGAPGAAEIEWVDEVAGDAAVPAVSVGKLDLRRPDVSEILAAFCRSPRMRSIRMSLCWDERGRWRFIDRPDVMLMPEFRSGLEALGRRGLVLDALVAPGQLPQLADLARAYPDQAIVIDHLGTPDFAVAEEESAWRRGMAACARCANVSVKISGLWVLDRAWRPERIAEPVRSVLDHFGPERCMWASNFPVEKLMCPIPQQIASLEQVLDDLGDDGLDQVFGRTAARVYRMEVAGFPA